MPAQFVILEHIHHGVHFDLMLEVEGQLRTWRLSAPPEPGRSQPAETSFAHRLLYLEYEGSLSGDRGHVRRWDYGTYLGVADGQTQVVVELAGQRLSGRMELRRGDDGRWMMSFAGARINEERGAENRE